MILSIVGPTASGKTAISLEVAELLGGPSAVEIISADAMQLYRGMDIGTAKIPLDQRRGIEHHQLDVIDISEVASVAAYQRSARRDLAAIEAKGKIPIIVGGSGLYVSGLLDKLDFPGHDESIRSELEKIAKEDGLAPLVAELEVSDPVAFGTIDLANPRRVVRALEVIRLTGHPYTPRFPRHTSQYPEVHAFGITREKAILSAAITERAVSMLEDGLIEETRELLAAGLKKAPTAARATGYAEAIRVIDKTLSEEEAVESISLATRRLTKKQLTWFRADPRVRWFDLSSGDVKTVAREIVESLNNV